MLKMKLCCRVYDKYHSYTHFPYIRPASQINFFYSVLSIVRVISHIEYSTISLHRKGPNSILWSAIQVIQCDRISNMVFIFVILI